MADRKLTVTIVGDESSLQRSFLRGSAGARRFESSITGSLGRISLGFGTLLKSVLIIDAVQKALEGLNATVHLGISEFNENQKVTAQTFAALKSTGGIANVTAKQIDALGLSLSNLSGLDDEAIRHGENLLLSFTNIRNFAGKNNDIFTQATKVMTDFSIRTGRDAASSAVILGRALEDPATRVASLSRAGVVFTRQQVNQLKVIEKTKGVLAAQKVLLQALEKRFAGAAKAAGQTLGGQLNILRDRFKDLAGSGVGLVAPAVTRAVKDLTGFVRKLSEATTTHAKFKVVFEGVQNLGRALFAAVQKQIESVKGLDRLIARKIGEEFRRIDWRATITSAAHKLGDALVASLNRITEFINKVNWNQVGREIVKGIGLAVGAVVLFLKSVNWGKVAAATFHLLVAAFKASSEILLGIGQAVGSALLRGMEAGLRSVGNKLEKLALIIVLKIIEPFTHLPKDLGGGPFQQMKATFQQTLDDMAAAAATGGSAIGVNLGSTMLAQVQAFMAQANKLVQNGTPEGPPIPGTQTPKTGTAKPLPQPPPVSTPPARKGITASQLNTFFDNEIARILLRGGLGDLQKQLAAINEASRLISQRIAATRDITRKLNLEDQLLQLAAQRKDILKQLKDLAEQRRDAQQFFILGLSPTGDIRVPLVKTLQRQLKNVSAAVAGTFLDTNKTKSVLANIAKVLSAGIGKVSATVRAKIKEMLDAISQQLQNQAGNMTKFAHANTEALLAGLGLSPALKRELARRLAQIGAGATVPSSRSLAFSAAGANNPVVVHTTVNLDGKKVAQNTTTHQRRANQRRSDSRRGPYAGRN